MKEGQLLPIKPVPQVDWTDGNVPLRNEKKVYAQIIFKNGDTLNTYIKVNIAFNRTDKLSEISLNKKVTAIIAEEKVKYEAVEIKSLRFVDFFFRERKFVLNGKELVEVMFDGKIKWYRNYYKGYDDVVRSRNLFVSKDSNHIVDLGLFNKTRNILKDMTSSRPDLIPFIESMDVDDRNVIKLLKQFEE